MFMLTPPNTSGRLYEPTRPDLHGSAAGLRGKMVQGHWEEDHKKPKTAVHKPHTTKKDSSSHHPGQTQPKQTKKNAKKTEPEAITRVLSKEEPILPKVQLPPPISKPKQNFEDQDPAFYSSGHASKNRRVVALDASVGGGGSNQRKIKHYPADFTDNTQLYSVLESTDERLGHMELRAPYSEGECVPMQDWQTTFHSYCNGVHELSLESLGETENRDEVNLFGTKGYWRNAWRLDVHNVQDRDTIVLKTLK
jgi:hypothetical protein